MNIGDKLSHYLLEEKIGDGGFGDVFRASDLNTGMEVAIKCSRPVSSMNRAKAKDQELRFLREVSVTSKLKHPGIVQLYEYGSLPDGTLYLVMEYVCGLNLETSIKRDAPFSYIYASQIILQVLDALSEAHHQGIVHRDLKPANIMLVRQGMRTDIVKLLDFGIAKAFNGSEPDLTRQNLTNAVGFGTPQYMPPEQFYGKKVGPHSDLYAVGLVFYELLTGKQACAGTTLSEVIEKQLKKFPEIPPPYNEGPLNDIFRRALAKQIDMRYSSAEEMYFDIDAITRQNSPYLAKYTGAAGNNRAKVKFQEATLSVRKNIEEETTLQNDDISTFETATFGNAGEDDITNSSTLIFADEATSIGIQGMDYLDDVGGDIGNEDTAVNSQRYFDFDEFGPTDDLSRVDPAVGSGTIRQNIQRFPEPPPAASSTPYVSPALRANQNVHVESFNPMASYSSISVEGMQSVPKPSIPKPSIQKKPPIPPPRRKPMAPPPPQSEEMRIATRAMPARPDFASLDPNAPTPVHYDPNPDISGVGTAVNQSPFANANNNYDDDDDLPPFFHEQPTKFLTEKQLPPDEFDNAEDLPPVFHEQRTHFMGKMSDKPDKPGLTKRFFDSKFYMNCRHAYHRLSMIIDILYDRHFPELVIAVCTLIIILTVALILLIIH